VKNDLKSGISTPYYKLRGGVKMTIKESIQTAREIVSHWVAVDGGLTMAASDLLHDCRRIEGFVEKNDGIGLINWIGPRALDKCSTGTERDLLRDAMLWAVSR
jgi:hypothetical protein